MSENHRTHDCPCNPTCMRLVSLDASCSSASRDMPSKPATPPLPSAPPAPLPPTLLPTLPTLSGCLGGALPSTPQQRQHTALRHGHSAHGRAGTGGRRHCRGPVGRYACAATSSAATCHTASDGAVTVAVGAICDCGRTCHRSQGIQGETQAEPKAGLTRACKIEECDVRRQ